MGVGFFQRAMGYVEKHARPRMTFEHTTQTNGTLLDDEWAAFFKEHNFLIGISIHGPRELHDVYPVDKGGRATFDKVMRGLRLLQKHGVEYNAIKYGGQAPRVELGASISDSPSKGNQCESQNRIFLVTRQRLWPDARGAGASVQHRAVARSTSAQGVFAPLINA